MSAFQPYNSSDFTGFFEAKIFKYVDIAQILDAILLIFDNKINTLRSFLHEICL